MAGPQIKLEMTGDEQKLARALTRSEVKIENLTKKLQDAGRAGKDAGEKTGKVGAKAVPKQTITSLGNYVKGFVSLGTAVALAGKALTDFRRIQDEAAGRIKTGELSGRSLAQVADTPAEFKRLRGISRLLRSEVGLDQIPANELTFAAKSAGLLNKALFFGGLTDIGFDPITGVTSVLKIQASFGGKGAGRTGAGTSEQLINKFLIGAGGSPEKAEALASAMSIAAVEFNAIGGMDEALIAVVGEFSKPFKTADIGAGRFASLSAAVKARRGLIDSELQGLPLLNELPLLAEQGRLRNEKGDVVSDLGKFLGSKEALAASLVLQKRRPEISAVLREVELAELQTGTANDALAKRLAIVESDPQLRAAKAERIATNRAALQTELQLGPATLQADSFIQDRERAQRGRGVSELRISLEKMLLVSGRFFRGDKQFLEDVGFDEERDRRQVIGPSSHERRRREGLGLDVPNLTGPNAQLQGIFEELRTNNEELKKLNASNANIDRKTRTSRVDTTLGLTGEPEKFRPG